MAGRLDRSCIAHRIGTAKTRFGIVLMVAAILGLSLTYVFTVNPAGISARVPATGVASRSSSTAPSLPVHDLGTPLATELAIPAHEVAAVRPKTAIPAATAPPATAAPAVIGAYPPMVGVEQLVPLVPLVIDIWNAEERYYGVSGSTPDELIASAVGNVLADPSGAARSTMAYVGPITWDHRPSYVQDPATGSCTMTGMASTAAYQATLPQWTAPSTVEPELLLWWQQVLAHIQEHESQHVQIFDGFVRALPDRVVGQPCAAWDGIIGQWMAELTDAHTAFDAAESHWVLPAYTLGG